MKERLKTDIMRCVPLSQLLTFLFCFCVGPDKLTLLYVLSSFAIIFTMKRELVTLLLVSFDLLLL